MASITIALKSDIRHAIVVAVTLAGLKGLTAFIPVIAPFLTRLHAISHVILTLGVFLYSLYKDLMGLGVISDFLGTSAQGGQLLQLHMGRAFFAGVMSVMIAQVAYGVSDCAPETFLTEFLKVSVWKQNTYLSCGPQTLVLELVSWVSSHLAGVFHFRLQIIVLEISGPVYHKIKSLIN